MKPKVSPKHIGNHDESWRKVCQQAIDETGFNIYIGPGTFGYDFALYSNDTRDHGPFHKRKRELAKEAGLIK